ncbi:hypothetical protein ACFLQI_03045 [Candidatus Undinarchaeota archaeon]
MPSEEKIWMLKKKKRNEMAKTSFVAGLLVMVGIALIFMLPMIEMPGPSGLAIGTLTNGDSCIYAEECASEYCRIDYDGGNFCAADSTSCVHDSMIYPHEDDFPQINNRIAIPSVAGLRCRYGHWSLDPLQTISNNAYVTTTRHYLRYDTDAEVNIPVFKIYKNSTINNAEIRVGGLTSYLSEKAEYSGDRTGETTGLTTFEVDGDTKVLQTGWRYQPTRTEVIYLFNFTGSELTLENYTDPLSVVDNDNRGYGVSIGNFNGADKIVWYGREGDYPALMVLNYTDGTMPIENLTIDNQLLAYPYAASMGVTTGELNGEQKIVTFGYTSTYSTYLQVWNYTNGGLNKEGQNAILGSNDVHPMIRDAKVVNIGGENKIFVVGRWQNMSSGSIIIGKDSFIAVFNFTNGVLNNEILEVIEFSDVPYVYGQTYAHDQLYALDVMNVSGEIKIIAGGYSDSTAMSNQPAPLIVIYNYTDGLNLEYTYHGQYVASNSGDELRDIAVTEVDGERWIVTAGTDYSPSKSRINIYKHALIGGSHGISQLTEDYKAVSGSGLTGLDVSEVGGEKYAFVTGPVYNGSFNTHTVLAYELGKTYASDVEIDIDGDSNPEFSHSGILDESSALSTIEFTSILQNEVDSCVADYNGNCEVNFSIYSDSAGKVFLDMLNVSYSTDIDIDESYFTMSDTSFLYGNNNTINTRARDLDQDASVYIEITYPDGDKRNHTMDLYQAGSMNYYRLFFTSYEDGVHTARVVAEDPDGNRDETGILGTFGYWADYSISGSLDKTSYGTGEQIMLKPATVWEYEFQLSDGVIPENLFAYETLEVLPDVMSIPSSDYHATIDDVDSIQSADLRTWSTSRATGDYQWDTQVYKVNITQDPSEIKSIRMKWIGIGQIDYDDYFTLIQLFDYDDNWVEINGKDFTEPVISTISAVINASSRNFFDGSPDFNSSIFALAQTQKKTGGSSCGIFCLSLYTDYISLALSDVEEDEWAKVTGWTDEISYGYLLLKIQYNDDGTWIDEMIVLDDTVPREISNEGGATLENGAQTVLTDLWNDEDTDTSSLTHGDGTYRIYMAVTDEENVPVTDSDGDVILITQEFTVDINLPDDDICYTNNMCTSGNCEVGICTSPEEGGSATSIPGVLPTAEDPPETDAVEGVSDDTVGLPVWTAITLKGKGVVLNVFVGTEGEVIAEVTDNTGVPLENVEVALITSTGAVVTARTNKVGRATIYNFPGDPLAVSIEAGGVEIATKYVESGSDDFAYTEAQEIQAAALSSKMGTWAAVLMVVLILPAVAFYLFAKKTS